jgi:hypothetical protein
MQGCAGLERSGLQAGNQQRGIGETRARAQQGVEPAVGFEVLDPSESGQDTLPGADAVARVLDDLQIAALPGEFDAEEHAAPLDGTARLERLSASRKLIFLLHAPLRGTANQRKYRPTPHQDI